jgi:hypothetical protein
VGRRFLSFQIQNARPAMMASATRGPITAPTIQERFGPERAEVACNEVDDVVVAAEEMEDVAGGDMESEDCVAGARAGDVEDGEGIGVLVNEEVNPFGLEVELVVEAAMNIVSTVSFERSKFLLVPASCIWYIPEQCSSADPTHIGHIHTRIN